MKIGISNGAFGRYGTEMYKRMKATGYDTVDYGMADTEAPLYAMDEEKFIDFLKKEGEAIRREGLEISQVHGPWRYPTKDFLDEDRLERMEKMKKSIRGTAALGCKNWVIHPIMPFGVEDIGTEYEQKTWDLNVSFFKELLTEAKAYCVTICFENMPFLKFSLSTPEQILAFAEEMNDENFKICLDTGHVNVFKGKSIGDAARLLGKHLRVMHCHDNDGRGDSHMMPFFGTADWADFSEALHDIGYNGSFSLECSPPSKLTDDIYSIMSKALFDIAKKISHHYL